MKRIWRVGALAGLASALLAASAAPVAAIKFNGEGLYTSFSFGVEREMKEVVIVDRTSTGRPRMTVGLVTGIGDQRVVLNLRSIGCNGTPRRTNRIAHLATTTNDRGSVFRKEPLSLSLNFEKIKSAWLKVGNERSCAPMTAFGQGADVFLAARTGRGEMGANALVVKRPPNGNERVAFVYDRAQAGDDYLIELHSAECGKSGASRASLEIKGASASGSVFQKIDVSGLIRSVRIRNVTDGRFVRCEPVSIIMANTEGD